MQLLHSLHQSFTHFTLRGTAKADSLSTKGWSRGVMTRSWRVLNLSKASILLLEPVTSLHNRIKVLPFWGFTFLSISSDECSDCLQTPAASSHWAAIGASHIFLAAFLQNSVQDEHISRAPFTDVWKNAITYKYYYELLAVIHDHTLTYFQLYFPFWLASQTIRL